MDKILAQQTGGFPMETDTLDFMQEAYTFINMLGYLGGNNIIVKGVEKFGNNGNNVKSGIVFMNGELLPFVGGTITPNVIIQETNEYRAFEDGSNKLTYKKRQVVFGNGTGAVPFSSLGRIKPLSAFVGILERIEKLEKYTKPFTHGGAMVFWNRPANEIPAGWQEAVNWRGRIAVGVDASQDEFNSLSKNGGSKTATLTAANHAPHGHVCSYNGEHSHRYKDSYYIESFNGLRPPNSGVITLPGRYLGSSSSDEDNRYVYYINRDTESVGNHVHNIYKQGEGTPFPILNPYRTVYYIEPIPE